VGAGAVIEDDLFEGYDQAAGVARLADLAQLVEPRQPVALGHAVADEDADFLVGGGNCVFEHGAELFVELLARHSPD